MLKGTCYVVLRLYNLYDSSQILVLDSLVYYEAHAPTKHDLFPFLLLDWMLLLACSCNYLEIYLTWCLTSDSCVLPRGHNRTGHRMSTLYNFFSTEAGDFVLALSCGRPLRIKHILLLDSTCNITHLCSTWTTSTCCIIISVIKGHYCILVDGYAIDTYVDILDSSGQVCGPV